MWTVTKKQKKIQPIFFIPHERPIILVEKKNDLWRRPLSPKIMGQTNPVGAKSLIISRYSPTKPQP